MEYRYAAGQNNGRITQQKNWTSGEEVTYTYDSLNRLVGAATTGPEWGAQYVYDGFGNLTQKVVTKGTAPSLSVAVDPATNRVVGQVYDAAGNLKGSTYNGRQYDALGRMTVGLNNAEEYAYDHEDRRVWKRYPNGSGEVYFYGADGRRLGTYGMGQNEEYPYEWGLGPPRLSVYFGGRLIRDGGVWVATDRLGSVRWELNTTTRMNYHPYGEQYGTDVAAAQAQNREKFGTYYRDGTGIDYADQRYYSSALGRFLTPDPYRASGGPADPQSWNRYTYTRGDPINRSDVTGLEDETPGDIVDCGPYGPIPKEACRSFVGFSARPEDAPAAQPRESRVEARRDRALGASRTGLTFLQGKRNWSSKCKDTLTSAGVSVKDLPNGMTVDAVTRVQMAASSADVVDGTISDTTVRALYAGSAVPQIGRAHV